MYDVEFFYRGRWWFHNQETEIAKAEDWAKWLRDDLLVPSRVVKR